MDVALREYEPARVLSHHGVERVEDLTAPESGSEPGRATALCSWRARRVAAVPPHVDGGAHLPVQRNGGGMDPHVRRLGYRVGDEVPEVRPLVGWHRLVDEAPGVASDEGIAAAQSVALLHRPRFAGDRLDCDVPVFGVGLLVVLALQAGRHRCNLHRSGSPASCQ